MGSEVILTSGMQLTHSKKNETFTELHKQAQLTQEYNISSYKVNENTTVGKRTVLICDDEKDLLFMFTIAMQESYDVLTAKSGEECIKNTLTQNIQEERLI